MRNKTKRFIIQISITFDRRSDDALLWGVSRKWLTAYMKEYGIASVRSFVNREIALINYSARCGGCFFFFRTRSKGVVCVRAYSPRDRATVNENGCFLYACVCIKLAVTLSIH